ncbi:MAG: sigma-70 family RNA polymerase sigma factor [Candidatus Marinimicrobia bacterium]|nr:sigma-70 family RNA polymerase sigma factor [Candidatus Neomarinimicrobiota bacterium]MCF7839989.1 sigma-70 family RNA polymerase sigma factor [Candidatus Neomarinimicrobiota bacterium]MCF7902982.1 sigma-70 family RNA polymerase sigma factor [Candidatus Neomarinimicrobiota bacterium]
MSEIQPITDEQLIAQFQAGKESAFIELVNRYKDRLLNFVYRFVGDRDEAEDIVQDTFLKVYKNRHAYREVAKFSTWIYTIAGNLARSELRKRRRHKTYNMSQIGLEDRDFDPPDTDLGPDSHVSFRFEEAEIQRAIRQLPDQFRTIIILRDIQELSYEEISRILDIPMGTVKSRVNRARLKMQELLKHLKENG